MRISQSNRNSSEEQNLYKIIFCYYNIITISKKMKDRKNIGRKWSIKYKKSINCSRPKGFSQK